MLTVVALLVSNQLKILLNSPTFSFRDICSQLDESLHIELLMKVYIHLHSYLRAFINILFTPRDIHIQLHEFLPA